MSTLELNTLCAIPVGEILSAGKRPAGEDYLPANGCTLSDVSAKFPELLHYLLTHPEVVISVEKWESLLAQFGGVYYFALDRDTIRLPDLRGVIFDGDEAILAHLPFPIPRERPMRYVKIR